MYYVQLLGLGFVCILLAKAFRFDFYHIKIITTAARVHLGTLLNSLA